MRAITGNPLKRTHWNPFPPSPAYQIRSDSWRISLLLRRGQRVTGNRCPQTPNASPSLHSRREDPRDAVRVLIHPERPTTHRQPFAGEDASTGASLEPFPRLTCPKSNGEAPRMVPRCGFWGGESPRRQTRSPPPRASAGSLDFLLFTNPGCETKVSPPPFPPSLLLSAGFPLRSFLFPPSQSGRLCK